MSRNLTICYGCRAGRKLPACQGACPCPVDNLPIVAHAKAGSCPLSLHTPSNAANTTPAKGPGTELRAILATFGITTTPTCGCTAKAATMDANGPDWCEANMGTVIGWLQEEAAKRGWMARALARPVILRRLVHLAISRARRG